MQNNREFDWNESSKSKFIANPLNMSDNKAPKRVQMSVQSVKHSVMKIVLLPGVYASPVRSDQVAKAS